MAGTTTTIIIASDISSLVLPLYYILNNRFKRSFTNKVSNQLKLKADEINTCYFVFSNKSRRCVVTCNVGLHFFYTHYGCTMLNAILL